MEPKQRDLYESLRLSLAEELREVIAQRGIAHSGIIVLDALLKLRQVCCDYSDKAALGGLNLDGQGCRALSTMVQHLGHETATKVYVEHARREHCSVIQCP